MDNRQLAVSTEMIRYFQKVNAPLSDFQQRVMVSALRFADRELYGTKGHPRCARCYSDISVGKVITVSPNANASFEFPTCMKHIQQLEAWLRNQVKKPEDAEHLGE